MNTAPEVWLKYLWTPYGFVLF